MANIVTRIEGLAEMDWFLGRREHGLQISLFAKRHQVSVDTVRNDLRALAKLGHPARAVRMSDQLANFRGSEYAFVYDNQTRLFAPKEVTDD